MAPEPINASDFGPVRAAMNPDYIKPGLILAYRGDEFPYYTPFLKNRGDKNGGTYMLPSFEVDKTKSIREGRYPDVRKWNDMPGDKNAEYEITLIETSRRGKPTKKNPHGKPLPDLVVLESDAYQGVAFGLGYDDLCCKFDLVGEIKSFQMNSDTFLTEAEIERQKWREQVAQDAW